MFHRARSAQGTDDQLVARIVQQPDVRYQRPLSVTLLGDAKTGLAARAEIDSTGDDREQQAIRAIGGPGQHADGVGYVTGILNPYRTDLPGAALIVVWPAVGESRDYSFTGPAIHFALEKGDEAVRALAASAKLATRRREATVALFLKDRALRPEPGAAGRIPLGTVPVLLHIAPLVALTGAITRT